MHSFGYIMYKSDKLALERKSAEVFKKKKQTTNYLEIFRILFHTLYNRNMNKFD